MARQKRRKAVCPFQEVWSTSRCLTEKLIFDLISRASNVTRTVLTRVRLPFPLLV
jgi:hypothetical protein